MAADEFTPIFYWSAPKKAPRKGPSFLQVVEVGTSVEEVCRKLGISDAVFYNWRKKCGGLGPSESRRLRQLEEENGKLKRLRCGPVSRQVHAAGCSAAARLARLGGLGGTTGSEDGVRIAHAHKPCCEAGNSRASRANRVKALTLLSDIEGACGPGRATRQTCEVWPVRSDGLRCNTAISGRNL